MKETRDTSSNTVTKQPQPSVPTHGNWAQERGFGQQISTSSSLKQYDLRLADNPLPTMPKVAVPGS
jgi:hypothetical protein